VFIMNPHRSSRPSGFTLVELMVGVSIVAILAAMSWGALQASVAEQRLRQAAVELEDLLNTSRTIAIKNSATCKISQQTIGGVPVFSATPIDTTLTKNSCRTPNPRLLNLFLITGKNLQISNNISSNPISFTFTKYGTLDGASSLTTYLGIPSATSWQWCIDVSAPAAIVRVGARANSTATCNYRRS